MSIFNRFVVAIVALALLVAAVITCLVAAGVSTPDILPYRWVESQLQAVADAPVSVVAGIMVVSIIIALTMIAILSFELLPSHKPVALLINTTDNGITTIDASSICVLTEHTSAALHNVHDVKSRVTEKKEGLHISCRPSVTLGSNLLELETELRRTIKETVEELTGLSVAQVDIKLKYESGGSKRLAVR